MEERERMLDTIMEMQKWNGIKDEQIEALEKENQALKERWQKLKEWVEIKYADDYIDANDTKSPLTAQEYYGGSADGCRKILDKMQELEKE